MVLQWRSRWRAMLMILMGSTLVTWEGHRMVRQVEAIYWRGRQRRRSDVVPPKLLILGSGWASVGIMDTILPGLFDVTVVSPQNYFLFTPLLPSAAVGTIASGSLAEPIRNRTGTCRAKFVCARARSVDLAERTVLCETVQGAHLLLEYDLLIIAVGAETNTFNTPGVNGRVGIEYAFKLKEISDARAIRHRLMANFEEAMASWLVSKDHRNFLRCVVVGGGPTGVEFAAETFDLLKEDMATLFPSKMVADAEIMLIQSADHILNTYDLRISQYTETLFHREGIKVLTNARVQEVKSNTIVYMDKSTRTIHEIPYGICVWATGTKMGNFIKELGESIVEQQHEHALTVDRWLRVKGVPDGRVFALGDCATIETASLLGYLEERIDEAADPVHGLKFTQLKKITKELLGSDPQLKVHINLLKDLFQRHCKDGRLGKEALHHLFLKIDATLKSLPATAQVASQEGRYLGSLLNAIGKAQLDEGRDRTSFTTTLNETVDMQLPFTYHHMGMAAYIGARHAVIDLGYTWLADRFLAFVLWRSIYLSEQISFRMRFMVAFDWIRTFCFGRNTGCYGRDGIEKD